MPELVAKLKEARARKTDLERRLHVDAPTLEGLEDRLGDAVARFEEMVANLETHAARDVTRARNAIKGLLGDEIRLVPNGDNLVAELVGDYWGLVALECKSPRREARALESKINLVAGAGFEPATFRL
ncbi:MAG: hypothetical protein AB1744_11020 [Candidatus Zixiibacteriota bacterium]